MHAHPHAHSHAHPHAQTHTQNNMHACIPTKKERNTVFSLYLFVEQIQLPYILLTMWGLIFSNKTLYLQIKILDTTD